MNGIADEGRAELVRALQKLAKQLGPKPRWSPWVGRLADLTPNIYIRHRQAREAFHDFKAFGGSR